MTKIAIIKGNQHHKINPSSLAAFVAAGWKPVDEVVVSPTTEAVVESNELEEVVVVAEETEEHAVIEGSNEEPDEDGVPVVARRRKRGY